MSNSLDPDQARQNVGPDLGPNCLQKLSADFQNQLFQKIISGTYSDVKQFGSRSGLTFCWA